MLVLHERAGILRRPLQRRIALGLAFLLAGCQTSSGAEMPPIVRAHGFAFPPEAGESPDFGGLEFRAGLVLASGDARFGGLSGLWIAPDGERLITVSDRGTLWLAEPEHADDGTLVGLAGWRAVEPGALPGDPSGRGRDAEALAAAGADLVIAYEGAHRLRRVPRDAPASRAAPLPTPPGLSEPHNRGMEALVALQGGALLAIAEGVRTPGGDLAAWVIEDDRALPLAYAPTTGFAPTGADRLEDTIYVLERRFSLLEGLAARVVALHAAEVRPGARLVGREIGVLGPPAISENFEGIAARRAPDGGVFLYLLSDDNFMPLLRSLLLQFSVRATPGAAVRF
jgi:hypothetical protein